MKKEDNTKLTVDEIPGGLAPWETAGAIYAG